MNSKISKSAVSTSNAYQPAFFYNSAREGMRDLLENVPLSEGGVLLPGFIGWSPREGSGVFDPVREAHIPYGFYSLNGDLSVDIDDLERRLEAGTFNVLVLIHYFGRTDPYLKRVRQLADAHGALLIEDLAHGFFTARGGGEAGRHGDASLFSLHKQFPLTDGGLVSYANPRLVSGQVETRPELASKVLSYDWRGIAKSRRRTFATLTSLLSDLPELDRKFKLLWPALDDHDVPQSLPVYILGENRSQIYDRMNADGYGMVSLYHTLIPQLAGGFPSLVTLSRHILNFPVHQDVDHTLLVAMVESFRSHLGPPDEAAW
ncbi:DegT/DnrJ/EryC1/StrS family aminotransferase [Mycetocola zhujimingii]|uniref:DegT/DnrJ/EryC1/StrS family aminotransferase n=1 Tax=Mycetocola zhujimingii TaxID=2079792 RepID=UPI000D3A09D8|nr:DegT/DnrJ/EryC1/StrS family aminotransferase [Mycetocola zhujimingii]AWB85670.1 aminotransferase DegT [Mycetocola zhujimingii]